MKKLLFLSLYVVSCLAVAVAVADEVQRTPTARSCWVKRDYGIYVALNMNALIRVQAITTVVGICLLAAGYLRNIECLQLVGVISALFIPLILAFASFCVGVAALYSRYKGGNSKK
jgi:hypothetical protein